MGGVSSAGFRPGLGFGGSTHSLFMEIAGIFEPGMGAKGLLTVEEAAGVRTAGGEGMIEAGMGRSCERVLLRVV